MPNVANLYLNLIAKTVQFDRKLTTSTQKLSKFQAGAKALGSALAMAGGAVGLVYAVKRTVREFAAFEKQVANVSTMLDKQGMKYLPSYERGLKQLAVSMGESTETLSTGLYNILSASIAPARALEVLTVATKAARAGLTDTATAADAIVTVLNSYNMEAEKAGEISDKLFTIVKNGVTTFGELAPNIGKVTALAATAGLSFDELGAAISTFTRAGVKTEIAMTGLRSIISQFISPTKEAQLAAKKFGLELNSNTLRTIGLSGVLKKLKFATAEQLATLLPNVRGMATFAAGIQNVEGNAEDLADMIDSLGESEKALEKQTDTLDFKLSQAGQAFKAAAREIGGLFAPAVTAASNAVVELTTSLQYGAELRATAIDTGGVSVPPMLKNRWLQEEALKKSLRDARAMKGLSVSPIDRGRGIKAKVDEYERMVEANSKILADERQAKAFEKAAEDYEKVIKPLSKLNEELSEQVKYFGLDKAEATFAKLKELGAGLSGENLERFNELLASTSGYLADIDKLEADVTVKEATKSIKKMMAALDAEVQLIGRLNQSWDRSREVVEFQILAEKAYGKQTEKTVQLVEEFRRKLEGLEKAKRIAELADEMGDAFGNAFTEIIFQANSAREVLNALAQDLTSIFIRQMVTKPLTEHLITPMVSKAATMFAPTKHGGGRAGDVSAGRTVSASVFAGAPRLHEGLMPDEIAAILKKDEYVMNEDTLSALGKSRGSGGVVNINLSAVDAQGVAKFLKQYGKAITSTVQVNMTNGNSTLRRING